MNKAVASGQWIVVSGLCELGDLCGFALNRFGAMVRPNISNTASPRGDQVLYAWMALCLALALHVTNSGARHPRLESNRDFLSLDKTITVG